MWTFKIKKSDDYNEVKIVLNEIPIYLPIFNIKKIIFIRSDLRIESYIFFYKFIEWTIKNTKILFFQ